MNKLLALAFAAASVFSAVAAGGKGNGPGAASKPTPKELSERAEQKYTPDVVELLEAKYWRDISNDTGRAFWHGRRTEAISDPSNMVSFAVYEDGRVFKDKAKVTTPAQSVKNANKKLPRTVDKKGVPKALAEAREKRAAEKAKGTVEVNREVKPGGAL